MNLDGYPSARVRGGSAALGLGGYGHGPFTGGGMAPQYMGYGYYMGMGGMGGMNGMGIGMNGMNGAMGMNGMNGMPESMAGMGMHPGMHTAEMGMHPGMGMYPGMPMHPGMNPNWVMGMGMSPNGMNGPGSMGMGMGMGMGGMSGGGLGMMGGAGDSGMGDLGGGMGGPGAWGPPVSNTRGEKEGEGEGRRYGLGFSNSDGRSGASAHLQPHPHPADPPTPPYTNEPPSPQQPLLPALHSDDAEHPGAGPKRALAEEDGDREGGRPAKRVRLEGSEGEADTSAIGSGNGVGGRPGLVGSATKTKEGLCQPSPETPSMRNLDALAPSEDPESDVGVGTLVCTTCLFIPFFCLSLIRIFLQHKYRHAESHMRQSSIPDAPHPSSSEQITYTPPSFRLSRTHSDPTSHPSPATADATADADRSDTRTHARYFAGPGHPSGGDNDDDSSTNAMYDASALQAMQMPFPCYTYPPPMPVASPMAMGAMGAMNPMGVGAGAGGANGMVGPMGGIGGPPMQQQQQQQPTTATMRAEPPMAGLGPPPPEEEEPPALGSALDGGGARAVKTAFSVCPPPRVGSRAGVSGEAGTSVARQARLEDIDPTLR